MDSVKQTKQRKMYGLSLNLRSLLQTVSSFFWINREYSVTGGTVLIAHITDAVLLIPLSILALRILSGKRISSQ